MTVEIRFKLCTGSVEREPHYVPFPEGFSPYNRTNQEGCCFCRGCNKHATEVRRAKDPAAFEAKARRHRDKRRAIKAGADLSPGIEDCLIPGYEAAMYEDDCGWCGKEIPGGERHFDHIQPLSKRFTPGRGTNDPTNFVAACQECNSAKSDKDPFDWWASR